MGNQAGTTAHFQQRDQCIRRCSKGGRIIEKRKALQDPAEEENTKEPALAEATMATNTHEWVVDKGLRMGQIVAEQTRHQSDQQCGGCHGKQ